MLLENILSVIASLFMVLLPVSGALAKSEFLPEQWDAYVSEFIDSYFLAHPDAAVASGLHEFDGKLPDWSKAGLEQEISRLRTEAGARPVVQARGP